MTYSETAGGFQGEWRQSDLGLDLTGRKTVPLGLGSRKTRERLPWSRSPKP